MLIQTSLDLLHVATLQNEYIGVSKCYELEHLRIPFLLHLGQHLLQSALSFGPFAYLSKLLKTMMDLQALQLTQCHLFLSGHGIDDLLDFFPVARSKSRVTKDFDQRKLDCEVCDILIENVQDPSSRPGVCELSL